MLPAKPGGLGQALGYYVEDTRPFGFRPISAIPNGFSVNVQRVEETPENISYQISVVDPSLDSIGPATFNWSISTVTTSPDLERIQFELTGDSVAITVERNQLLSIEIERDRNGSKDTLTLDDRTNDLDRNNGNAFIIDAREELPS